MKKEKFCFAIFFFCYQHILIKFVYDNIFYILPTNICAENLKSTPTVHQPTSIVINLAVKILDVDKVKSLLETLKSKLDYNWVLSSKRMFAFVNVNEFYNLNTNMINRYTMNTH